MTEISGVWAYTPYPHFTGALPGVGEALVGLQYILVIWGDVAFRQDLSDRPIGHKASLEG